MNLTRARRGGGSAQRALRLAGPGRLVASTAPAPPPPGAGMVTVRLSAAGVCGSDLPHFASASDPRSGRPGFPIHECAGTVVASGCGVPPGARVVAMPVDDCGLVEVFTAEGHRTHVLGGALDDLTATLVQPLSTVLAAVARLGDVRGCGVAVLGLGPVGLLAGHALRQAGAGPVVGADPVDRGDVAAALGLDGALAAPAASWWRGPYGGLPVDVCVEAVGHDERVLADAVEITRERGRILALGVPDEASYRFPYERFFRKNLTLVASVAPDWQVWLPRAERYLVRHEATLRGLITDVYPVLRAGEAFRRAGEADARRVKVGITAASWQAQG